MSLSAGATLGPYTIRAELDEGHVAKLLGDGTLVYFGYPQAHA